MNTYSKLRDGTWGVRGLVADVKPGATITVTKKGGQVKPELVGNVIWTDGTVALATITKAPAKTPTPAAPGKPKRGACSCEGGCCTRVCKCDSMCNCRGGPVFDCA